MRYLKTNITNWHFLWIFAFAALLACNKKQPCQESIECVIKSAGTTQDVQNQKKVTNTYQSSSNPTDSGVWLCNTNEYSVVKGVDKIPVFNPNANVIYPGNLLQGKTVGEATPSVIPVKRAGATFSINLVNGSWSVKESVYEVTKSDVTDALNEIVSSNNDVVPAKFSLTTEKVNTKEELALSLGVNVKGSYSNLISGKFDFSASYNSKDSFNRFLVKLKQRYFTMSMDLPTSLSEVFAPSVRAKQLAKYVGSDNPATYISDVTYGRVYYLLVESKSSSTKIEGALNGTFDVTGMPVSGGVNANVKYLDDLKDLRVKVLALGGESKTTFYTITKKNLKSLSSLLSSSGSIETGVPLSYVVRNVYDNSIVDVRINTKYDHTNCEFVEEQPVANRILAFDAGQGVDVNADGEVYRWENMADNDNPARLTNGNLGGEYHQGGAYSYVRFQSDATSNDIAKLNFSGQDFVDAGTYTIFAVVRTNNPSNSDYLFGSYSGKSSINRNLRTGFMNNSTFRLSHSGYNSGGSVIRGSDPNVNPSNFALYTYKFSMTDGMAVYYNGTKVSQNSMMTSPLVSYNGAAIGNHLSSGSGYVDIAEIKAFSESLSATEQDAVEAKLKDKYSL